MLWRLAKIQNVLQNIKISEVLQNFEQNKVEKF